MGSLLLLGAGKVGGSSPPVPIGTPVNQGVAGIGTAVSSVNLTTLASIAVGDLLVIAVMRQSSGVLSASDALGGASPNVYTTQAEISHANSTNRLYFIRCKVTEPIPAGTTITISNTVTTRFAVAACSVSGIAASPFDQQTAGNAATDAAPTSLATGTLAQASEILIGAVAVNSGYNDTFTQPSGWTALTKGGVSGENGVHWGYKIVSATTAETYGPGALSASRTWLAGVTAYKGA